MSKKGGGLTKGKSHAKGGIKMTVKSTGQNIEVEGGEGIINKYVMSDDDTYEFEGETKTACEIASNLNQRNGNGVKFSCEETEDTDLTPMDVEEGFAKGGDLSAEKAQEMLDDGYANGVDLTDKQKRYFHAVANGKDGFAKGGNIFGIPNAETSTISNQYIKDNAHLLGISDVNPSKIYELDYAKSIRLADAYEEMLDNPTSSIVQEAYEVLAHETEMQYNAVIDKGYKLEIWNGSGEPYANSAEVLKDISDNKHMYIFGTEGGFGEEPISDLKREQNAMLRKTPYKDIKGKPLLVNDLFRFVHDFFGHSELGNGFGAIGEENAWNVHSRMFSPLARKAMTTETRGQNSWVNFGKHIRRSDNSIPKKGDKDYIPLGKRPFAEQKMNLIGDDFTFAKGGGIEKDIRKQTTPKKLEMDAVEDLAEDALLAKGGSVEMIDCQNCSWSWKASEGGDDLYICHKCYTDNKPFAKGGSVSWFKSKDGKGDSAITKKNVYNVQALKDYGLGDISYDEYLDISQSVTPIEEIDTFYEPATYKEIYNALQKQNQTIKKSDGEKVLKQEVIDAPIKTGEPIGVRLDIPSYVRNNTWVVSIHGGHKQSGRPISYQSVVKIKDVTFGTIPSYAFGIAVGDFPKNTIGRMYGYYDPIEGVTPKERSDNSKRLIEVISNDSNWKQIGMNPFRHSYFYLRENGMPVVSADEVVQIGGLVYGKNPKTVSPKSDIFKAKHKDYPYLTHFSKGGSVDDEISSITDEINRLGQLEYEKEKRGEPSYSDEYFNSFDSMKKEITRLKFAKKGLSCSWSEIKKLIERLDGLNKDYLKNLGDDYFPYYGTAKKLDKTSDSTSLGGIYATEVGGYLFRGVSVEDFERIVHSGYIDTDMRGAISNEEGINLASNAGTAFNYLPSGEGVVMAIMVSDKSSLFMIGADDYVRTLSPIPISDIKFVTSPCIEGRFTKLINGKHKPLTLLKLDGSAVKSFANGGEVEWYYQNHNGNEAQKLKGDLNMENKFGIGGRLKKGEAYTYFFTIYNKENRKTEFLIKRARTKLSAIYNTPIPKGFTVIKIVKDYDFKGNPTITDISDWS